MKNRKRKGYANWRGDNMLKNGNSKDIKKLVDQEREISPIFSTIDTDLARDNLENDMDMTAADVQDL